MTSILYLNGPNLNLLGTRQTDIYGSHTLGDIEQLCLEEAKELGVSIEFKQENSEGAVLDRIHETRGRHDGLILNAGAYTHTSIAIRDAVTSVETPTIELHLSNVFARETFRHMSYISPVAVGVICGFGAQGYALALRAIVHHLGSSNE
ncbi:MAG: type II 3-dehydroquinate dehydratase [Pseudomonadota bacterium]